MEKILVFGDIHGRKFWKKPFNEHVDKVDKVVFIGDYLDFYPDEWEDGEHTRKDDIDNFLEIIDLKTKYGDKVVLLIGNHCQHYRSEIFDEYAGGTRKDNINSSYIKQIFDEFKDYFQLAYEETIGGRRFLFTHAGVCKSWYEKYKGLIGELNADNLNKLDFSDEGQMALSQISNYRSWFGEKTGSILWSDVRERYVDKGEDIEGVYQVFGHTRLLGKPIITEQWACIDCSKPFMIHENGLIAELKENGQE